MDRNARERYRDHPWFDDCAEFGPGSARRGLIAILRRLAVQFRKPGRLRRIWALPENHDLLARRADQALFFESANNPACHFSGAPDDSAKFLTGGQNHDSVINEYCVRLLT